jgi:hypothetical protein
MAALRLQLARRTMADDLAEFPVRRLADCAGLVFALLILGFRIQSLQSRNRVEFSERTARFAVVKRLSDRVLSYSEQYGRPIFMWTGVNHASAAESTLYENLRLDLRDQRVRYWYSDRSYSIAWWDPLQARRPDRSQIVISNAWPVDAAYYARWRWYVNHPVPPRVRAAAPVVK